MNKIYWRCWRKECRASLTTQAFELDIPHDRINVLQVLVMLLVSLLQ